MKKLMPLLLAVVLCASIEVDLANAAFNGLPDSSQTPGAFNSAVTQDTIDQTICVHGYTATIRPKANYTTGLKIKQLDSGYNVGGDTRAGDYEEDHLVPLEIGGNPSSPSNLWPELWKGSVGAHIKDKLENRIHSLICNGTITLAAGRSIFTNNWEAGYTKWIGALPTVVSSTTKVPAPKRRSSTSATNSSTVHPGSFCPTDGATGVSKSGKTYTCKTSATDTRDRWRK